MAAGAVQRGRTGAAWVPSAGRARAGGDGVAPAPAPAQAPSASGSILPVADHGGATSDERGFGEVEYSGSGYGRSERSGVGFGGTGRSGVGYGGRERSGVGDGGSELSGVGYGETGYDETGYGETGYGVSGHSEAGDGAAGDRVRAQVAAAHERARAAAALADDVAALRVAVRSPRGEVTVEVDAGGRVTSMAFTDRARAVPPAALGRVVEEALRAAARECGARAATLVEHRAAGGPAMAEAMRAESARRWA